MLDSFRLTNAVFGPVSSRSYHHAPRSKGHALGSHSVEFTHQSNGGASAAWVTVIIGKNGVGKTRLLAGIANIFDAVVSGKVRRQFDNLAVSEISYEKDGRLCKIQVDRGNRLIAAVNGRDCDLTELPLPTKVIALTTTPFDKFRVPRPDEHDHYRYAYLGLRDRSGRASPTAAIFRALEGLFEASKHGGDRRPRIAEVFSFLGYEPHVEVHYELSLSKMRLLAEASIGASYKADSKYAFRPPLVLMLDRDPSLLDEIRGIAEEASSRAEGGRSFTIRADFKGFSPDDQFFRRVQLLRRAGLVRMRAAEVQRSSDGAVLDLKQASSGELGIVIGFLGLASVIENDSLIFIDEPEISLHPEWQTQYIDLLLKTFQHFSGCHFILATHSPLILSDIAVENSTVVSLDQTQRDSEASDAFAGLSSDHLLVTAFKSPGKNNLYLKQEVIKALRLAASGQASTDEFANVVGAMVDVLPNLEENSPVAQLIRGLQSAREMGGTPK